MHSVLVNQKPPGQAIGAGRMASGLASHPTYNSLLNPNSQACWVMKYVISAKFISPTIHYCHLLLLLTWNLILPWRLEGRRLSRL